MAEHQTSLLSRRAVAILASAFVIGLSGAMMPGPLLAACFGYSLERGFWAGGPLLVLGHALLEGTLVALVLAGLGPVLSRRPVRAGIGLLGGAVLVWMGCDMVAFAASGAARLSAGEPSRRLWANPVVAGAAVSLANPYWSIWWVTIGLGHLSLSRQAGRVGVLAFYAGHQLSDVAWYCFVAAMVAVGRTVIPDAAYRGLIGGCGVVLLAFALYFLWAGARHFARRRAP